MVKKSEKTERMLSILRENFTDSDYKKYIDGELKMKDVYAKYNCTQNAMDILFRERGYIKRKQLRESQINVNIFNPIETNEAAYILGFYIADGCLSENKFVITLNEKDKEILEKIRDIISPITKLIYRKERTNKAGITVHPMYSLSFTCREITTFLNNNGLGNNKTYLEKSIKNIVPTEFMWDFIRGYFDGDGCITSSNVSKKKHTTIDGKEKEYSYTNVGFTIISKDHRILEELNDFFNSEGINTHVYPDNKGNYLVGTHSYEEISKIYNRLYNNKICLERKYKKFSEIMQIPR